MRKIAEGAKAIDRLAIEKAKKLGTRLVVWRDGRKMEIDPNEATAMLCDQEKPEN